MRNTNAWVWWFQEELSLTLKTSIWRFLAENLAIFNVVMPNTSGFVAFIWDLRFYEIITIMAFETFLGNPWIIAINLAIFYVCFETRFILWIDCPAHETQDVFTYIFLFIEIILQDIWLNSFNATPTLIRIGVVFRAIFYFFLNRQFQTYDFFNEMFCYMY